MSRLSRIPLLSRVASWRTLVLGVVIGAAGCALVAAVVLPPWLLTHRNNLPGELRFGRFAVSLAARLHSGGAGVTPISANSDAARRGEYAYIGSCAMCHGADGTGKGAALAASLFPPATDLTGADAKAKSDAELFWITKNGLSFTAMPGFRNQYNDQMISAIVAYLRVLQNDTTPLGLTVPTPTDQQLAAANVAGDAVARGAAVYFAQGCQQCHGATGDGPGELRLREVSSNDASLACTIRNGPNGMPAYGTDILSDAQLTSLTAYLRSLSTGGQGDRGGFRPEGTPPPGATPFARRPGGDRGGGDFGGGGFGGGANAAQRYSSQAAASGTFTGCPGGR